LKTAVDDAFTIVIAKKAVVDSLGLTQEVHDTLIIQKAAVNEVGVILITKVPASLQALAQSYIDQINASFDETIAAYA
jgi:hypothetical protein